MPSINKDVDRLSDLTNPTRQAIQELKGDWGGGYPPKTTAFGTIGRVLANRIDEISNLDVVLRTVEELMVNGDLETQNAVATGLLEALLSEASAGRLDFRKISPLLGKKSREYCSAWDQFTGVRTQGLD